MREQFAIFQRTSKMINFEKAYFSTRIEIEFVTFVDSLRLRKRKRKKVFDHFLATKGTVFRVTEFSLKRNEKN